FNPADLDGTALPPIGAPEAFVEWPAFGSYTIFHFHPDFVTPANTTFTLFASPPAAGFTRLCPGTRACVPQLGSADGLDGIGDRGASPAIFPAIGYAGRLASDPLNTLAQGQTTLFSGTGSQTDTGDRWGDYSDMTVDPVDDCTFWYTQEYYAVTSEFTWRTR